MKHYSTEEVSELYNIKPATIRKWIREGKLKAVKLGHLWRIREDDLKEFIKQDKKDSAWRMFEQWKESAKED